MIIKIWDIVQYVIIIIILKIYYLKSNSYHIPIFKCVGMFLYTLEKFANN